MGVTEKEDSPSNPGGWSERWSWAGGQECVELGRAEFWAPKSRGWGWGSLWLRVVEKAQIRVLWAFILIFAATS